MIRALLPVAICALATPSAAQTTKVCENVPFDPDNCVRVLACIGDDGLIFDGQARGWDTGAVTGFMSDGTGCNGTWTADGPLGTGTARMTCEDGSTVGVVYYSQDNITGTVIGRGTDSKGRAIQVWSGENVLEFLTPTGSVGPALPCIGGDIPLS